MKSKKNIFGGDSIPARAQRPGTSTAAQVKSKKRKLIAKQLIIHIFHNIILFIGNGIQGDYVMAKKLVMILASIVVLSLAMAQAPSLFAQDSGDGRTASLLPSGVFIDRILSADNASDFYRFANTDGDYAVLTVIANNSMPHVSVFNPVGDLIAWADRPVMYMTVCIAPGDEIFGVEINRSSAATDQPYRILLTEDAQGCMVPAITGLVQATGASGQSATNTTFDSNNGNGNGSVNGNGNEDGNDGLTTTPGLEAACVIGIGPVTIDASTIGTCLDIALPVVDDTLTPVVNDVGELLLDLGTDLGSTVYVGDLLALNLSGASDGVRSGTSLNINADANEDNTGLLSGIDATVGTDGNTQDGNLLSGVNVDVNGDANAQNPGLLSGVDANINTDPNTQNGGVLPGVNVDVNGDANAQNPGLLSGVDANINTDPNTQSGGLPGVNVDVNGDASGQDDGLLPGVNIDTGGLLN